MVGERLEVEHLRALRGAARRSSRLLPEPVGAADDAPVEARRQRLERGDDGAAEVAVAALEHVDAKADLVEHRSPARRCACRRASSRRAASSRAACRARGARCARRRCARPARRRASAPRTARPACTRCRSSARSASSSDGQLTAPGRRSSANSLSRARVDDGVEARRGRASASAALTRDQRHVHGSGAIASSSSVSICSCSLFCCSAGPSIRKVSSTRSPSVVILASCRLMWWRASTRAIE